MIERRIKIYKQLRVADVRDAFRFRKETLKPEEKDVMRCEI